MKLIRHISMVALLAPIFLLGCGDDQKLAQLERKNRDLQAKLDLLQKSIARANLELQDKCSMQALKYYESWREVSSETVDKDYTSHYNLKENRCFVLLRFLRIGQVRGTNLSWLHKSMWLFDAFERRAFGEFSEGSSDTSKADRSLYACNVASLSSGAKIDCWSEKEFETFIKPIMEE